MVQITVKFVRVTSLTSNPKVVYTAQIFNVIFGYPPTVYHLSEIVFDISIMSYDIIMSTDINPSSDVGRIPSILWLI